MRILLIFLFTFFLNFSFGQEDNQGRLAVGFANNTIFPFQNDGNKKVTTFSPGIFGYLSLRKRMAIELGINLEHKRTNYLDATLSFPSNITNGTTSVLVAEVDEKYIHGVSLVKLYLNDPQKIRPFFGAGLSLRIVHSFDGIREIRHSDGVIENLNSPVDTDEIYFHPGVLASTGFDLFFEEKLMITFQANWNYFYKNNLPRYNPVFNRVDTDGDKQSFRHITLRISAGYIF